MEEARAAASKPGKTATSVDSTSTTEGGVAANAVVSPAAAAATTAAGSSLPPLFNQSSVRKPEYWQFAKLIAPAATPPASHGKKGWTADDAVGIWCLRCSRALSYRKGSSQSIRYHMETKHSQELEAFRQQQATKPKEPSSVPSAMEKSSTSTIVLELSNSARGVKRKASVGSPGLPTPASPDVVTTVSTTSQASSASLGATPASDDLSWRKNLERRGGFWGNAFWYDLQLERRMPLAKPMLEELVLALPPCDGKRVLDLCAGSGRASAALLAAYPTAQLTLLDSSTQRLTIARQRLEAAQPGSTARTQFVPRFVDPSEGAKLCDEPVDVVVGCLALHVIAAKPVHYAGTSSGEKIPVEETYAQLFGAIWRALCPGGHVVFADHVGQLALFKQLQAMQHAGFEDVDCAWRQGDSFVAGGRKPRTAATTTSVSTQ